MLIVCLTIAARIEERLNIVETFVSDVNLRQSITEDHLRRVPDIQRLTKKLQNGRANLQDCFKFVSSSDCLFSDYPRIDCYFFKFHLIRIYQVLARLPTLLDCLSEHDGPHSAVLFAVFTEPLRLAEQKLAKLKGMIETTVDIALASQKGEFVIKSDFDEDLKGAYPLLKSTVGIGIPTHYWIIAELRSQMDEYESEMDKLLNRAARDLNLEPSKSVKLESNPQFGHYFRVTLKDEKMLRNNRAYSTIDTNKSGVRFRNAALEEVNKSHLKAKREYEQQQQSIVKDILNVAGGSVVFQLYFFIHFVVLTLLSQFSRLQ